MKEWAEARSEFPSLERWTYLNTATFGQHPLRAERAIAEHLAHRTELACQDFLSWFDDHDRLRGRVAELVHCQADDVAFFTNTSAVLGLLLNSGAIEPGEILTLEGEFPNQVYGPHANGFTLREVAHEALIGSLSTSTRLVAISEVNYITGARADVDVIAGACASLGVPLYVDGTQSLGALRFDFRRVQPSVYAVNAYKWMCCPSGIALAAIHPSIRERMRPLSVGWRSHQDWRNVERLHHGAPVFNRQAEMYEGGMLASPLLYALDACVGMFLELEPERVEQRVMGLAAELREGLRGLGLDPLPHYNSPIVSVPVEDSSVVASKLKEKRVLVSARYGLLRVSAHFYNNSDDVARFVEELGAVLGR